MSLAPTIEVEKPVLFTMRWMSSALVMVGHAYSIIFHAYDGVAWSRSIGGLLEHLAMMRHGAVIIFFVMSGYLVGGNILSHIDKFEFKRYFINRFSRIYIVLLPALALTIALDLTAYIVAPNNEVYTTIALTSSLGIAKSIFDQYDLNSVLATFLSLESIIGTPMGSNWALWSLGIEWFFYFLFPAAIFLGIKINIFGRYSSIISVAVAAGVLYGIGLQWIAVYWIIWSAGAYSSQIRMSGRLTRFIPWIAVAIAFCALLGSHDIPRRFADPLVGIGFALFLTSPRALNLRLHRSLDKKLTGFSYSLYVTHEPVLVFTAFLLVQFGAMNLQGFVLSWTGLACFLTASLAALTVGYIFGQIFERRTDNLKQYLSWWTAMKMAKLENIRTR